MYYGCTCFRISDQSKTPSNEDGTVDFPIADSRMITSEVTTTYSLKDIMALFMALNGIGGPEIAASFLDAMANCPEDEKIVFDVHTEKLDGSTRPYDPMKDAQEWLTATEEKPFFERDMEGQIALATRYQSLVYEEASEINDELGDFARGHGTLAKLAKEINDMLYHCYCLANLMEIPVPPVFQLVHANNMTKVDPETGEYTRREDGKVEKPIGFKKLTEEDLNAVLYGLHAL